MARLAKQGDGLETLVERHADDLGAFGYHYSVVWMEAVAELVVGQAVVNGHSCGIQTVYFCNGHEKIFILVLQNYKILVLFCECIT